MERETNEKPRYLVCYDRYKMAGWRDVSELHELLNEDRVDWYFKKGDKHAVTVKDDRTKNSK